MRALASSEAIGGEVSARRPSDNPTSTATTHHPAATGTTRSSPEPLATPASVTAARTRGGGGAHQRGRSRKSEKRTKRSLGDQAGEQLAHAFRSVDDDVGLRGDRRRSLLGSHPDPDASRQPSLLHQVRRAPGRRRGRWRRRRRTARIRSPRRPPSRKRLMPAPLSILIGGRTSSTLRPQWVRRPAACARSAIESTTALAASSSRAPRQWKATIGALVLEPDPALARVGGVGLAAELVDPAHPVLDARRRARPRSSRPASSSTPCEPRYEIVPIDTIARASEARRPLTHATRP